MKRMNLKNTKHILFDYDGILVDSEKLYFDTWCSVLNPEGQKICAEFHKGKHEKQVFEQVKNHLKTNMNFEQISAYRKYLFNTIVANNELKLIPDILYLLDLLYKSIPLSIVSNSEIELVKEGIDMTKIGTYFQNLFCYNDNLNRKPEPDLYYLALETLKLNFSDVLAIEDSISGLSSAKAANIPVICINSDSSIKKYCINNQVPYFSNVAKFIKHLAIQ